MSENEVPVRFELIKNGERRAVGGVEYGSMTIIVNHTSRDPKNLEATLAANPELNTERYSQGNLSVEFGGMVDGTNEYMQWVQEEPIKAGDEILVRPLGPGPVDEPILRKNTSFHDLRSKDTDYAVELQRSEKAYYDVIDSLLSGITLSPSEYYEAVRKMPNALRNYKQAVQLAIERSEGEEQEDYRMTLAGLQRFPANLLALLAGHRQRIGIEPD